MAGKFLHDADGVEQIVSNIEKSLDSYEKNIDRLTNLVNQIESSNAWKDATVKTAFLATARAFLTNFNTTEKALKKYKKYLRRKSKSFDNLEKQFS